MLYLANLYKFMKIILLNRHGILPSIVKRNFQKYESKMVRSNRQATFKALTSKGWCNPNDDVAGTLTFFTFERCGIVANELRDILNKQLANKCFLTINIGGHYVVQSQCTGLIYDLVSTEGLKQSEKY